jgi:protoheme IX farnesyltransferase
VFGGAGVIYLVGAMLLGAFFFGRTVRFTQRRSDAAARRVLWASLVYLPAIFALLVLDGLL